MTDDTPAAVAGLLDARPLTPNDRAFHELRKELDRALEATRRVPSLRQVAAVTHLARLVHSDPGDEINAAVRDALKADDGPEAAWMLEDDNRTRGELARDVRAVLRLAVAGLAPYLPTGLVASDGLVSFEVMHGITSWPDSIPTEDTPTGLVTAWDAVFIRTLETEELVTAEEAEELRGKRAESYQRHTAAGRPGDVLTWWWSPDPNRHGKGRPVVLMPRLAERLWVRRWRDRVRAERERAALFGATRTDPTPWSVFPMGADVTAVRVATSLTGDPSAVGRERGKRDDTPTALVVKWDDGGQLTLPFNGEDDGPFLAVAKQYGPDALAHLWALVLLHWASGRPAGEPFPWFPADHLWALGQTDSHAHERMHEHMARFARSTMQAVFADGGFTEPSPLAYVLPGAERRKGGSLVAGRMMVHPALTFPAAQGGGWWPADLRLIRDLPRRRVAVAAATPLAVLMGNQWSTTNQRQGGPAFSKRIPDLAAAIGRPMRGDRDRDARTVRDIETATEALEAVGFVGRFELDGDILRAWPAVRRDEKPHRPALLPATGEELAIWLEQRSETVAATARAIGVTAKTLRNGVRRGSRYLPTPLRSQLLAYLWSSSEASEPEN